MSSLKTVTDLQGMKRFHIRNEIIKALKEKGLYIEAKDNEMQIPICSRSGDVVEQIMKPQWWVSCKPMAEEALKVCDKRWIVSDGSEPMPGSSRSNPRSLLEIGLDGWRICRIGVSRVNCGGVTDVLLTYSNSREKLLT
jgi:valyl-tRNA synthetase